jgi:hypothetical protein
MISHVLNLLLAVSLRALPAKEWPRVLVHLIKQLCQALHLGRDSGQLLLELFNVALDAFAVLIGGRRSL